MHKMGFHKTCINMIMNCVKTVSYSILINGEPKGSITPSRALRQGDPLSPYLFLLGTKSLISLLQQVEAGILIIGIKKYRRAPHINHLLFVDNSVLFCKSTIQESVNIKKLLEIYEHKSGQKVNRDKNH